MSLRSIATAKEQPRDDLTSGLEIHVVPFFGEIRAADFTTQHIKRYVAERRTEGAQDAII